MRPKPITLVVCLPHLKQTRPPEAEVGHVNSLLQPLLLFHLGDSTVCLWSVPAAHIPRARGSEGLWQLSWTQAGCFAQLFSEVCIKLLKPRSQGSGWAKCDKMKSLPYVSCNTWSQCLPRAPWHLYASLSNVESRCVIKTQKQGHPIIRSSSLNAAEFIPVTLGSSFLLHISPERPWGQNLPERKERGGRMSRKHPWIQTTFLNS